MASKTYRAIHDQLTADVNALEGDANRLRRQLEETEKRLAELGEAREVIARVMGGPPPKPKAKVPAKPSVEAEDGGTEAADKDKPAYGDLAEVVLREAGTPLHLEEIIARISQISGGGAAKRSTVFAAMKRRGKVFQQVGKGTWSLKK